MSNRNRNNPDNRNDNNGVRLAQSARVAPREGVSQPGTPAVMVAGGVARGCP